MRSKKQFAKTLMIVAGFTLGLMLQATAAEAGRKHKDKRKAKRHDQRHEQRYDRHDHRQNTRYGYDYRIVDGYRYDARRGHRQNQRHAPFRIPNRIRVRAGMNYGQYFHGERFHRGHGHMHMVYRFPVYTDYGVEYRAASYCQGDYYRTGRFVYEGPRYGFSIQF